MFPIIYSSQAQGTEVSVDANTNPPSVKEKLVRELLEELDLYKLIGPDNKRLLRELANAIEVP